MKTLLRVLVILCLLAGTGAANGQMNPRALLLDSVYSYNWVDNSWTLDMKNYRIKDGSGKTIESLFKKFNSGTGQFRDFVRTLYTYQGSATVPSTITDQLWYAISWNTLNYTHYLANDIIDTAYIKNWDGQHHKIISGYKNTFQYNDSLLPVENIVQVWDTTTLDWFNSSKTTFSYTPAMQPLERVILSWQSTTSTWNNIYKYTDVYDMNNVLTGQYEYAWNDTSAVWESTVRVTYFNNPTSMPNRMVKELWNSSLQAWDSVEQSTYLYNQFNWLMTVSKQVYLQNSGEWVNDYLTYYTYSYNGIQQSITGNVWDSIHLSWISDSYQLLDSATQKLAQSYSRFVDPQTFLIMNGSRNLYSYNANGDTTNKVNQMWNVPGNGWVDKTQVLYTYDSHNLLTEDLTQNWESVSSTWINAKKSDYFYSEFIGINENQAKVKPCFYANPMKQGDPINCPFLDPSRIYEFEIFTVKGESVYKASVNGGSSFVIKRSMAAGNYILRISGNGKMILSDKIIIIN